MASVMPSDRMLSTGPQIMMNRPGKNAVHHLPSRTDRFDEASTGRCPRGHGGRPAPEPMKVRVPRG